MTALPFFTGSNSPEIQAINWLVKDFLARGAGTILFGQPGVSKTAHSAVLCASLCQGKDFAGMTVQGKQRVLYLDFDGGWNWTGSLFQAAFRGQGLEGLPENFLYWSPLTDDCKLPDDSQTALEFIGKLIAETVKAEKVDVVVIDSLGQGMSGDQNSNQDAAIALRLGLNDARAAGASILVVDHASKAARIGGDTVPTPSGAQQKRAWARVTVALEQEGDGDNRLTRWSVDKSNAQHFRPFLTRLVFQNDSSGQLDNLRLELVGEAGSRPKPSDQKGSAAVAGEIMALLTSRNEPVPRKEFGRSGTVDRVLRELIESGQVIKTSTGFYALPNLGKDNQITQGGNDELHQQLHQNSSESDSKPPKSNFTITIPKGW